MKCNSGAGQDIRSPVINYGDLPEKHSRNSIRSGSTHTTASRVFQKLDSTVVSISETEKGGEVVVGQKSHPPYLVGFLQGEEKYTMWQIDCTSIHVAILSWTNVVVVSNVTMLPREGKDGCKTSIIHVQGGGVSVPVNQLIVSKFDLDSWNLCAFGIPNQTPASKSVEHSYLISPKSEHGVCYFANFANFDVKLNSARVR